MAENKTKPTSKSVDAYLRTVQPDRRREDAWMLKRMMEKVTGWEATMWGPSIVGFGSYHYKYDSGREGDFLVTGFAPRKQSLTVYIMSGLSGYSDLLKKLGKHKRGKGCLYINKLADVDMGVLETLIRKSVADMRRKYDL